MADNENKNVPGQNPGGNGDRNKNKRHGYYHGKKHHGKPGRADGQQKNEENATEQPKAPEQPRENRQERDQRRNNPPQQKQNQPQQKQGQPQQNAGQQPQRGGQQQSGAPRDNRQPRPNQNPAQNQNERRDGDRRNNDRRDRRRDRKRQQQNEELPQSLVTESFFQPPKEESIFAATRDEEAIIDSMPPDPTLDEVFNGPAPKKERTEGTEIVGIHFPQGGKVYYFDPAGIKFEKGSFAIVETARGQELGEVAIANRLVADEDIVQPLKPVIRAATESDLAHHEANAKREAEALKICAEKVQNHKLDMKLTGAQYTFDNAKLIFYFTAAQRVDFRELVKDLASTFHTRIELRQIGTRDEAKMFGGLGVCGRKLCCSAFLPNYAQVSIKMAKKQGLALNSAKISGNCGRLMCCLRYEQSTYERELAVMPTVDSVVDTPDGRGVVTDVRPVGYTLKVRLDEKPEAAPKTYKLGQIKILVRAAEKSDEDEGEGENED